MSSAVDSIHAIHYPPRLAPRVGRLLAEIDYDEYVKQLVLQVLMTAPGERVNRPEFGAGLRRMVFAPNNPATASMLDSLIVNALTNELDRYIRLDEVATRVVDNCLSVDVAYTILARGQQRVLNLEVSI